MSVDAKITDAITRPSGEVARHIARAAARLFADRGYDATSVREIVEAAGVTKPTLYYHFGSKQGLAEALLTRPMTEFIASLRALIDGEPEPLRLLRAFFEAKLTFLTAEPDRARFFFAICFGPQSSSLVDEILRFGGAMDRLTVEVADRLAQAGLIEPDRAAASAQTIRGLTMSSTMDYIFLGREPEPGLADRLVSDFLHGFGVPGSIETGRDHR